MSVSAPIIALTISFGLSSLILLVIGKDPYETFKIMFEYGIRGKSIVSIINRSIPLYISLPRAVLDTYVAREIIPIQ